jgi:hypothetical protein
VEHLLGDFMKKERTEKRKMKNSSDMIARIEYQS